MSIDEQPPVTILSGGLGAGKTTLLNHLLTVGGDRYDIAVLVNDVGEMNVDAELIENGSELSMDDDGITELSNGCICCGLQNELDQELRRLAFDAEFDHLVIEASGISDPVPIAQRFLEPARASTLYDLDTTVTVVDAAQFHRAFVRGDLIKSTDDDAKPLSDLLAEQVEFCDVLVLNKCDLVSDEERRAVERVIRTLHPDIDIVGTVNSAVDPERVLETGRFDRNEASYASRWKQALSPDHETGGDDESQQHDADSHGHDQHDGTEHDGEHGHDDEDGHDHDEGHHHDDEHDHLHPPEEFGVDSFVYERRRPFHPGRLRAWLDSFPETVVRSKGHMWVAGRERFALDMSQAGTEIHVDVNGRWAATLPERRQASYRESRSDIEWDDEWGDRETKLVFIGAGMDESAIVDGLDDCLVDTDAIDGDWSAFDNPFPGTMDWSKPPMQQRLVVGDAQ